MKVSCKLRNRRELVVCKAMILKTCKLCPYWNDCEISRFKDKNGDNINQPTYVLKENVINEDS